MTDQNTTGPEAPTGAMSDRPVERARKRMQRRLKAAAIAGIAVVAGGAAYRGMSQGQMQALGLTAIVPQNAEMVLAGSPDYFWNLTSSIRTLPQVQKPLTDMEQKLKITYEDDIKPWVGQVAFYAHNVGAKSPDMAVLLQVRDADAFSRFYDKLKPQLTGANGAAPVTKEYGGVTYFLIPPGASAMPKVPKAPDDEPSAVAMLNGWVLLADNEATVRSVIDTYSGKAPSIQSSPKWAGVVKNVAMNGVVSGALDIGAFTKMAATQAKAIGGAGVPAMPNSASAEGVMAFSYNDAAGVLRTDAVFAPQSPALRATYAKMAAKMYPVTGVALRKAPDAAMIGIISNPGYLVRQELKLLSSTASTAKERKEYALGIKKAAPYLDISDHFTGPASMALTWNPDHGFGVVALAQADTAASALRAARVIAKSAAQSQIPIVKSGTSWSMPSAAMISPIPSIPLTPVVAAQDRWLEVASHPFWIHPASRAPQLSLPAEASHSGLVGVGNFKWVPTVLDLIGKSAGPKDEDAKHGLDLVRGLHLETATWSTWSTTDPTGAYTRSTAVVRGFDLKGAIDNTVTQLSAWYLPKKINGNADVTAVPAAATPVKA